MAQVMFFLVLIAGLFFVGGFLWSMVEQKPRALWLVGAAITIFVGVAGLVMYR
jgi:uncharacterized protein (DUF983 family)